MKKTLLSVAAALTASAFVSVSLAQLTRQTIADCHEGPSPKAAAVTMDEAHLRKLRANIVDEGAKHESLRVIDHSTAGLRRRTNRAAAGRPSLKAASKATAISGYVSYTGSTADPGWYSVSIPDPTIVWKRSSSTYSPSCGFVRGDELYAFYCVSSQNYGLTDAGLNIQDLATGTVKENVPFQIFDTLDKVTYYTAYDEASDEAYVITSSADGNGYKFQKFDPESKTFTDLGVTPPDNALDMGWNPSDQSVYILCDDGAMRKYDPKAKKFNQVTSYSYDMTDYPNDMVWSPKDDAFLAMLDSYDDNDEPCTDMVLLNLNGTVTYLGTLSSNMQFPILEVADKYINANGAKAPVMKAWNVSGPATSGEFTVTLPSAFENGNALTGIVYLDVTIDGEKVTGSFRGNAGTDVTVPFSSTEGLHRFAVAPYTLSDNGRVAGTPLIVDRYLGHDAPAAPANVTLAADKVTWSAVTAGAYGGYIDAAAVRYNVFIDGVKMNETPVAGTSLAVTIPATGQVAHRAMVYAVAGDKTSQPGESGKFYTDGALSLPVSITPDAGSTDLDDEIIAMFTVVKDPLNTESLRGWRYDDQSERTGGFYCLAPKASSKGDTSDEWLFLPAINFTDKDAHYRFSMDVWTGNHYFTADETYEVVIAQRPTGTRTTVIREAATVHKSPNFELSETLFQVPESGEWYIGIHYISPIESYRLYARNFKVEVANASADSPAAVTDLEAEAAARGELKAKLTFTMPSLSISGKQLAAGTMITTKAVSEAGEATISGTPGQKVTLDVPTLQGENIIRVTTSSDAGTGLVAEVTVYTGVYRPATPIVETKVSDDNQKLTLAIDIDDFNDKDEYVDPAACDVTIYRKIGNEWRVAAEIGKARTWEFDCPAPDTQDMYLFGVAAKNVVGNCEEMFTFGVHLGKLFTLPMKETFPTQGENVNITYEPLSIDHLSYLQAEWGFCEPTDLDDEASNTSGVALYARFDSESQLLLPRFSTLGLNNVKVDLSLFFGNKFPESVTVFASSPAIEMEPVATFTRESGKGWEHKLVSLPATFQNKGWVQICIRVNLKGYSQALLLDSYSVADYPDEMFTISGIKGNTRGVVGDKLTYSVEVENAGTSDAALPGYTFKVLGDNGIIADLQAENAPATVGAGKKAVLDFSFDVKAAHKGDALVRFNLLGQPSAALTEIERNISLLNAPVPVVNDLAVNYGTNKDVLLSWTKPVYTESFEAFEPWACAEEMRGWRNLDLDKSAVWGITEVNYEGKGFAKAFQVFSSAASDNPYIQPHSGEHYMLGMSASSGVTDDWLISPEVKGGTKIAFWMNILDGQYPETVLVKYSSTGNDTDDFTQLDGGYICPDDNSWQRYEFTLPADARYFALHHVGDDGSEQFGLMLDDVTFDPVDGVAVESYNLYRDDELIAAGITDTNYTDRNVDFSVPVRYYVKSNGKVKGESVESDRSNVVWANGQSGIDGVEAAKADISGIAGAIKIAGYEAGVAYTIADLAGRVVAADVTTAGDNIIAAQRGVYVVKCGKDIVKVAVK